MLSALCRPQIIRSHRLLRKTRETVAKNPDAFGVSQGQWGMDGGKRLLADGIGGNGFSNNEEDKQAISGAGGATL